MDLSIIIVNYNVKYFCEQCIASIQKSETNYTYEIILIDNASNDGSQDYLTKNVENTRFIWNKKNLGFSKANNQAIKEAKGNFILLLNPDTILAEDTLEKTLTFIHSKADCGAAGIRMVDANGHFLPESKRGLPTPSTAFYKLSGLAKLFNTSKRFNYYHLGHLPENQTHIVDVLSGAFMLIRKKALDASGLLDEQFFMYGEDIDLSYRIQKAGYNNYYFSDSSIIHYKGESTKKNHFKYHLTFHKAMYLFAKKHFADNSLWMYKFIIFPSILALGILSYLAEKIKTHAWLFIDFIMLCSATILFKSYYTHYQNIVLNPLYFYGGMCVVGSILVSGHYLLKGYQSAYNIQSGLKSIAISGLLILAVYGILPESIRFSRAIILFQIAFFALYLVISRTLFFFNTVKNQDPKQHKTLFISALSDQKAKAPSYLKLIQEKMKEALIIPISIKKNYNSFTLSDSRHILQIQKACGIDSVIFDFKTVNVKTIIALISKLKHKGIVHKIAHPKQRILINSTAHQKVEYLNVKEL